MLWFERRVVETLAAADDPARRARIASFVDGALRSMPEYLRAGVAAESLLLGAVPAARSALGRGPGDLAGRFERWQTSRVSLVRQYARMLHSLTLFARHELPDGGAGAAEVPAGAGRAPAPAP